MNIFEKIINTPQAETAGSSSASRFKYQKNWGLGHLLKLHRNGEDYLFAFEFHDDILLFDSKENPKKISFFQVKTKQAKNWTVKGLTTSSINKKTDEIKLSILGKLYHHKINFNTETIELAFITNSYFSFFTKKSKIQGTNLTDKDKTSIIDKINTELPTLSIESLSELSFIHADLSLDDQDSHIKGKIQDFFRDLFGEEHGINIESWYKSLITEIDQKNNFPQADISNQNEFFKYKCISKSYIQEILNTLEKNKNIKAEWRTIKGLIHNAKPYEMIQYEKNWNKFATEKLDSSLFKLHKLYEYIYDEIEQDYQDVECIYQKAKNTLDKVKQTNLYDRDIFPDNYIETMIFWSYYECSSREI